ADGHLELSYADATNQLTHTFRSTPTLAPLAWSHVAASYVFGTSQASLYLNGAPVAGTWTLAWTHFAPQTSTAPMGIGGVADAGLDPTYGFDGWIAEARAWKSIRSASEIAASFKAKLSGAEPGLVGDWRLEEGAGSVVFDSAAGHHDGGFATLPGASVPSFKQHGTDIDHNGQLDACQGFAWTILGSGVGAFNPLLTITPPPWLGKAQSYVASGLTPGAPYLIFISAGGPTPIPLDAGAVIYPDLNAVVLAFAGVVDGTGHTASHVLNVPADTSLFGIPITTQALSIVPGAPVLGSFEITRAFAATIGVSPF
ncbi:MAG TPA: LamG-like jellyroll fold domain-containing protein, partial [Planctomycetota bacterium]|nr:LamG-like jellyroll fold domain-containing protein [Planctomycetota bacterium]